MYTLGIETSCDETSSAIIRNRKVYSCIVSSSLSLHKKFGGIVPEIASRAQLELIYPVTWKALKEAGITLKEVKLLAVTSSPGLVGSLLVGLAFSQSLAYFKNLPLLEINHLHSHLFAPFLNRSLPGFPFLGLVVSGGHTELYSVRDFDNTQLIGKTRDDACGEALDKVGRFYGLGYPAGPEIDRIFNLDLVDSTLFNIKDKEGFDFSFSGIKTRAIYLSLDLKKKKKLTRFDRIKILSSFQFGIVNYLIKKLTKALNHFKIKKVVCGGGVSANSFLRRRLKELEKKGIKVYLPEKRYCADNAASVAGLGEYIYKKKKKSELRK